MTRQTFRRAGFLALRVAVGCIFVYAGVAKVSSPQALADHIAAFRLLPASLISPLALGLPPFEIALGAWLISGWHRRTAAFGVLGTTGIFLLALISALARGLPVDCGCFGASASAASPSTRLWLDLGRDALLLGVTLAIYIDAWPKRPRVSNVVTPAA